MASRYWVGGNGNWDAATTTHWAASSGGAGGASVPTSADDVFIDALSGSSPIITVTATASCLSLDFTGSLTPTFTGGSIVNVYGNLIRIAAMTWTYSGTLTFAATATGKTITSSGVSYGGPIIFNGIGGGWTLQDNLNSVSNLTVQSGSFFGNGKAISVQNFTSNGATTRVTNLTNCIVTCSGTFALNNSSNTNTLTGSTINMTSATATFGGGSITTYNIVNLTGALTNVSGNNTINTLNIIGGKIVNVTAGTTQTITNLNCNGTSANPNTLQSSIAGTPVTIALPAARHFIRHTNVKDIIVSGATSLTDIGGTDVSGNTGITFVTKFEIGRVKNDGSFNWYSAATGALAKVSG